MILSELKQYFKLMFLELWRQPSYLVSTLAFPALFYAIFAIPESQNSASANFLFASFSGFAFFGVVFLQFGVALAQEKAKPWSSFVKSLPMDPQIIYGARLCTALVYANLSVLLLALLALAVTPLSLRLDQWIEVILVLNICGLSFCLMGVAFGLIASERNSLPLGNLIYLPLTFVGGLWKPPELLPQFLHPISPYLPTRMYGNLLWAVVQNHSPRAQDILGIGLYTAAFLLIVQHQQKKSRTT